MKRMMFIGCVLAAGLIGGCSSTQQVASDTNTSLSGGQKASIAKCADCKDGKKCAKCAAKCDMSKDKCDKMSNGEKCDKMAKGKKCDKMSKEDCKSKKEAKAGCPTAAAAAAGKKACGPDCTKPCCAG